jgi:hypothetical protein
MEEVIFEKTGEHPSLNKITVKKDNWHKEKRDIRFSFEIFNNLGQFASIQLNEEEAKELARKILSDE